MSRGVAVGVVCVVALASVAGCGSGTGSSTAASGGAAVRVGPEVITAAAVRHWFAIEAILSNDSDPKGPAADGVIPDPPNYTACIAHLQAVAKTRPAEPTPNVATLKHECQARYQRLHQQTVTNLITDVWVRGEAAAHHLSVSDSEVQSELAHASAPQLKGQAALQSYLRYTGLTMADELGQYRRNMLTDKLLRVVLERPEANAQQHKQAYVEFVARWVSKTSCEPEYIVPDCKQYKGPLAPGN